MLPLKNPLEPQNAQTQPLPKNPQEEVTAKKVAQVANNELKNNDETMFRPTQFLYNKVAIIAEMSQSPLPPINNVAVTLSNN